MIKLPKSSKKEAKGKNKAEKLYIKQANGKTDP